MPIYSLGKIPPLRLLVMLFPHRRSLGKSIIDHRNDGAVFISSDSNRFFNDTELKNSPKYKAEAKQNVYSLTVNKCDHPDVGTYRVHVDNGIDHTDQTAQLKVGGMFCRMKGQHRTRVLFFSETESGSS